MSDPRTKGFVIAPGNVAPRYLREHLEPASGGRQLEQSRWAVLTVLFIVTGAFGLPILWRSDRFSRIEKCFWGVMVTVYTVALFYGMFLMVRWSVGDAVK